jgi:hypothetical protein
VPPSDVTGSQPSRAVNVVVATTVMLSFISFWRAAAIVLSDLASSERWVRGWKRERGRSVTKPQTSYSASKTGRDSESPCGFAIHSSQW